jgi:tripartite-type tricarboxylate transporter receptor subunit TctC
MKLTFALAGAVLAALLGLPAAAQDFPTHSVRITSPFPTGSGPDVVARILAEKLQSYWNQPVVVEARPGANGVIAIDAVKRAAADGHELVIVDNGHVTVNPSLFSKLPYDVDRDLAPVALVYRVPFFITVSTASPIQTVPDLIAAAKDKPGTLSYGTPFIGSPAHLGSALFEAMSGTKMNNIPFKETSQLFSSVASGDVTWALGTYATTGPLVRSGKLRLVAVAASKRTASNPDVPTVAEVARMPGYEVNAWVGMFAPKNTPAATLEKINADVNRALGDTEVRQKMMAIGNEPTPGPRAEFASVLREDTKKYAALVKSTGIKVD